MKLKAILLGCLFGLAGSTFAAVHTHADVKGAKDTAKNQKFIPGCQITVVNESQYDADVYGTFDDGGTVNFRSYAYTGYNNIEMYYYDPYVDYYYCHNGMNINIYSLGRLIYAQYTPTNRVVLIKRGYSNQLKVSVSPK